MAESRRFLRAAFSSMVIVGCAALGVAVMSDTYAGNNFSGAFRGQCKIVNGANGLVKGLAIEKGAAKGLCVCPSQASYQNYRRRYPGEASENCIIQNPQNRITNFNQPSTGPGTATGPGPGTATGPGPGTATGPGPGTATGPGPGSATGPQACHPCNNGWGRDGAGPIHGSDGVPGNSGPGSNHGPQGGSINADSGR
jgi:hypothetical protein